MANMLNALFQNQAQEVETANLFSKVEVSGGAIKFDVAREINTKDWQRIEEFLLALERNDLADGKKYNARYFTMLFWAAVLRGDHARDMGVEGLVGYSWERLKADFDRVRIDVLEEDYYVNLRWSLVALAALARVYFPDKAGELNLRWASQDFFKVQILLSSYRAADQNTDAYFALQALVAAAGFADESSFFYKDAVWPKMKGMIEREYSKAAAFDEDSAECLAEARILYPEKFEEFEIGRNMWMCFKQTLNDFRQNENWVEFLEHAYYLHILAAESVQSGEEGIKVVAGLQEDFNERMLGRLPCRRSF